jgi:ribosomal small subunit protein bTHX
MGKGDKKSRRGKIIIGTYGVRRPKRQKNAFVPEQKPTKEKAEETKTEIAEVVVEKKKPAIKKSVKEIKEETPKPATKKKPAPKSEKKKVEKKSE